LSKKLSSQNRLRKSVKQNIRNRKYKSVLKTTIKDLTSITDKPEAEKKLPQTISLIDKIASKGIIPKNQAANKKSQLTKLVNSL